MRANLALIGMLAGLIAPAASLAVCEWIDSDLQTGLYGPKKYWGDTNIAYAGFLIFSSGQDYVYRFRGSFPESRYMSIESSKIADTGLPDVTEALLLQDFDDAIDYMIVPDNGSENPFTEGTPLDVTPRSFTVDAVPEGAQGCGNNQLAIPSDGSSALISFRAVSPNEGVEITESDLPTITALDAKTCQPVDCSLANPVGDLVIGDEGETSLEQQLKNLRQVALLYEIENTTFEKYWPFKFRLIDVPFEGSAGIEGYLYGLTKMTPGKVTIVRFKAPSTVDTYPSEVTTFSSEGKDMRYWSLCALDVEGSFALACVPDHVTQPNRFGYVTIAYGPESIRDRAESLGYSFLEDRRELGEGWEDKPVAFIYRQLLPSESFAQSYLNQGDYVPKARVCSESAFLLGWCRIW